MRSLGCILLFALLPLVASACSSNEMTVVVESDTRVNGGRSLYVLARRVARAVWETEREAPEKVSKSVFAVPADPTVIKSKALIPGTPFEMTFKRPEDVPVALYFFFTDESERWTVFFELPVPEDIEVILKRTAITAVDY